MRGNDISNLFKSPRAAWISIVARCRRDNIARGHHLWRDKSLGTPHLRATNSTKQLKVPNELKPCPLSPLPGLKGKTDGT